MRISYEQLIQYNDICMGIKRLLDSKHRMYNPTHLDFERIIMRGPNPAAFDEEMPAGQSVRFVNAIMNRKQLKLKLLGKVADDLHQAKEEYGGKYSFMFKPNSTQLPNLERLESIFENDPLSEGLRAEIGLPENKYTHKFTIGETNSQIRIKFPQRGDLILVDSNKDLDIDGHIAECRAGVPVEIDVAVSYYFRDGGNEEDTYGMMLKLLEIRYNPAATTEITKIKPVKKKINKQ